MAQTSTPKAKQLGNSTTDGPLPVLDIINNMIIVTNYISAIQNAKLPKAITDNPIYNTFATNYSNWQYNIWQQYIAGLVNAGIAAQVEEINELITIGITEAAILKAIVTPPSSVTPSVISMCDDLVNQITAGTAYLTQLQQIADGIQNADEVQIAALDQIVSTLNSQFNDLEEELTDKALDNSIVAVVTVINVVVAIGTETNPVDPLVKGVSQIANDVVNELNLSDDINTTLSQLETAWSQLDDVTLQLARIILIINKVNSIVSETEETITALNNIVTDWQAISDAFNLSKDDWNNYGLTQVTEWANRMGRVNFAGNVIQTVSAN